MSKMRGMIQRKGEAERPKDIPAPAPSTGSRAKSLTLRLSDEQYERLRTYAFTQRRTHQDVIEDALMRYLDGEGA